MATATAAEPRPPDVVEADGLGFGQIVRIGAALATAGAGVLHLDAASDHTDHAHIAAFFVAVAVGQLAWAASVAGRSFSRRTLLLGLLLNAGVLATWIISRTVGLPTFIPDASGVEELGWKDAAASGLGLTSLAAGGFAMVMPAAAMAARLTPQLGHRVVRAMAAGALAVTVPGVLVAHEHGTHGHEDGTEVAHGHGEGALEAITVHDHTGDAAAHDDPGHVDAGHDEPGHHDDAGHDDAATGDDPHIHAAVVPGASGSAGHAHGDGASSAGTDGHAHDDGSGDHQSHAGDAFGPAAPDPLAGPGTISTLRIGPIPLLPSVPGVELPHMSPAIPFVGPGRVNVFPLVGLPPPCTDCYVLGVQPDLVYADGSPANLDTGPMLHHAVFTDLSQTDPVCGRDTMLGQLGHRLFAVGNERTGGSMPDGFGVALGQGLWGGVIELMNMSAELRNVYVEATVRWVPSSTPGIRPVTPVWLDIDSCGDSEVDVGGGVSDIVWDWQSNLTGRIVAAGGHVHDGGEWLSLHNQGSGEHVCTSVAGYGTDPRYMGTLESMSYCVWDRLSTLRAGDVLRLNAHYNTSAPAPGVMGIMLIFVHETDDLTAGTQSPYPSEPPPDGAPPDTGHQH